MMFRIPRGAWKGLTWLPVLVMFNQHCYTVKFINGVSMQPTLNPEPRIWKDLVVFDRWSIHSGQAVKRGDVVALWSPVDPKQLLVKRVIALEGDVVQTRPPYPDPEVEIPEGQIWIEGDEAFRTYDSNGWGPVSRSLVDAKLAFIVWPPNRFGPLRAPALQSGSRVSRASQSEAFPQKQAQREYRNPRDSRMRISSE